MTETEKQAFSLIISAESALFYMLTDGDHYAIDQAQNTIKQLRDFLESHKEEIIKNGV